MERRQHRNDQGGVSFWFPYASPKGLSLQGTTPVVTHVSWFSSASLSLTQKGGCLSTTRSITGAVAFSARPQRKKAPTPPVLSLALSMALGFPTKKKALGPGAFEFRRPKPEAARRPGWPGPQAPGFCRLAFGDLQGVEVLPGHSAQQHQPRPVVDLHLARSPQEKKRRKAPRTWGPAREKPKRVRKRRRRRKKHGRRIGPPMM